ncbi:MAG: fibrobacter succinogenes major paralogous domain-containing protein, partial [Bacillota bacterium]
ALSAIIISGCEPDEPVNPVNPTPVVPVVNTIEIMYQNPSLVIVNCIINDNGGTSITEAGICWRNDSLEPTVLGLTRRVYVKEDVFSVELNVSPSTTYTVRAYAKNSVGVSYGGCITFKTDNALPPEPRMADIDEGILMSRTSNSAIFTGTVIDSGYCHINEVGICWSKSGTPDIYDYRQAISNPGVGKFTVRAPGLEKLSDYIARIYVTNVVGTNYGDPISFYTYDSVVDADGNYYLGVRIGSQVWLTANLKTTHFNNGDAINYVTDDGEWAAHANPAYCWYDNDATRANTAFGALYNYKVIVDPRGVAPEGYRIPSKEDIMVFGDYFGLEEYVTDQQGNPYQYIYKGGKSIRSNHYWIPAYIRGNNSTGFTAIPGGFRFRDGYFLEGSSRAPWWTTTIMDPGYYWTFYTGGQVVNDQIWLAGNPSTCGMAIRCLKN